MILLKVYLSPDQKFPFFYDILDPDDKGTVDLNDDSSHMFGDYGDAKDAAEELMGAVAGIIAIPPHLTAAMEFVKTLGPIKARVQICVVSPDELLTVY